MAASYLPGAPHALFATLFWFGAILAVIPLPSWLLWRFFKNRLSFRELYAGLSVTAFWILLVSAGWILFAATLSKWSTAAQPDVTLCLVYSNEPALIIRNISDSVAEGIKYAPALFDLDSVEPCSRCKSAQIRLTLLGLKRREVRKGKRLGRTALTLRI